MKYVKLTIAVNSTREITQCKRKKKMRKVCLCCLVMSMLCPLKNAQMRVILYVNQKYWPNRFPLGQAKLMPWSCMFLPICLRGSCSKFSKKSCDTSSLTSCYKIESDGPIVSVIVLSSSRCLVPWTVFLAVPGVSFSDLDCSW